MYKLNNLSPAPGARKNGKRKGRGPGSGNGTTAGRGSNGQGSRSGGPQGPWFEGGQMPLYRRLPKRGFSPRNRQENSIVNLDDLGRVDVAQEITVDTLRQAGLVNGPDPRVKILGRGELAAAVRLRVHAVSASARQKIEEKGGSIEIVPHGKSKASAAAKAEDKGEE